MRRPPLVLGLTPCEDIAVDAVTGNVSILCCFSGLGLESFPAVRPFCVFAFLTAGLGDAQFVLEGIQDIGPTPFLPVSRVTGVLHFQDPLQTVNWVVRLNHCWFPTPGDYLFTRGSMANGWPTAVCASTVWRTSHEFFFSSPARF